MRTGAEMDERDLVIQELRKEQDKLLRKIDNLENELWRIKRGLKNFLDKYDKSQAEDTERAGGMKR
jgi:predicted RNase H-like nuclease (RuvC/YqgF family)